MVLAGKSWRAFGTPTRGLHGPGVPENSLAAFRRAAEAGYGAELDVHLTRDGRLVVIHDGDLERMCGVPGRGGGKNRGGACRSPAGRLRGTHPSSGGGAPPVCRTGAAGGGAEDRPARRRGAGRDTVDCLDRFSIDYCVESFDPRPLRWLRRHRPSVLRGQLSQDFHRHPSGQGPWNRLALTNLFYNAFTRPDFVAYRFGDREKPAVRLCRQIWDADGLLDPPLPGRCGLAEQEGALPIFEEPDRPKEVTH